MAMWDRLTKMRRALMDAESGILGRQFRGTFRGAAERSDETTPEVALELSIFYMIQKQLYTTHIAWIQVTVIQATLSQSALIVQHSIIRVMSICIKFELSTPVTSQLVALVLGIFKVKASVLRQQTNYANVSSQAFEGFLIYGIKTRWLYVANDLLNRLHLIPLTDYSVLRSTALSDYLIPVTINKYVTRIKDLNNTSNRVKIIHYVYQLHDIDIVVPLFHVITEKERQGGEERKETVIATGYLELIELIVCLFSVILVPHSHTDPGWLKTFEQYFHSSTRSILNNMVSKLQQWPNMTFIWSEVSFLSLWWDSKREETLQILYVRKYIEKLSSNYNIHKRLSEHSCVKQTVFRTQASLLEMDCCKIGREDESDRIGNWMVVILESLGAWKNEAETREQRRVAVLLFLTSRGKAVDEVGMKKTEKCHEFSHAARIDFIGSLKKNGNGNTNAYELSVYQLAAFRNYAQITLAISYVTYIIAKMQCYLGIIPEHSPGEDVSHQAERRMKFPAYKDLFNRCLLSIKI
ncbi:Alpha-mannosidase 2x [Acromyrmex echinatior]|uniref:Alpha-mannosidase 2x n=1 Tax=Acromyrmex echinatior TaxID=103372 RepID=F4X7I3_ACREC|nr:Alpha-mannosidase 2x [Acromyrmex echinatior]